MGLFSRKTPEEKFMEKCSKANELFEEDRYDEALEIFLEAEEMNKKVRFINLTMTFDIFYNLSRCFYKIGNEMLDAQDKHFIELGMDPKKIILSSDFSKSNNFKIKDSVQENFLRGLEYCDKAIDLFSREPLAWILKGMLLQKIYRDQEISYSTVSRSEKPTRTKDAIECFEKAASLDPANQITMFNLAMSLHDEKEFKKSIEYYGKAIKINPHSDIAKMSWNNMGCTYDILGNPEEADKCYVSAKEFDST